MCVQPLHWKQPTMSGEWVYMYLRRVTMMSCGLCVRSEREEEEEEEEQEEEEQEEEEEEEEEEEDGGGDAKSCPERRRDATRSAYEASSEPSTSSISRSGEGKTAWNERMSARLASACWPPERRSYGVHWLRRLGGRTEKVMPRRKARKGESERLRVMSPASDVRRR